jgi:8-oxo-dGTP pyrophosphatase MutT (NUDIX family)
MPIKPDVTVAAVVEERGRFLLVEGRIQGRLVLNQPAGHVEDRETLLAAAIREAREETAWTFEPEALVGTYLWRNPSNHQAFLRFAFCGSVRDHDASRPLDTGIVRAVWMSRDEVHGAAARVRSPLVLRCIDDYLGGQRSPLTSVSHIDLETAPSVAAVISL